MKLLNKKILAILALLSVTGYSFGYNFDITNKTKETLVVKVKPRLGTHQFGIIEPDKEKTFAFTGLSIGLCLESIYVGKYDPKENDMESYILHSASMEMVDNIKNFMEKKSDEKTDKTVHATAPAAPANEPEKIGAEKIKQAVTELSGISLCQSRKFVLVDTGKEVIIDAGGRKISTGHNQIIALTEKK